MDSKKFIKALDNLVKEKDIDKETIFTALELALASAYKKNFKSLTNVKVIVDRETGDIKVYSYKLVVDEQYFLDNEDKAAEDEEIEMSKDDLFFNEKVHIDIEDAKKIDTSLNVGDTIDTLITPEDFGRVAVATAKQVVIQKVREAERASITKDFENKEFELVVGTLDMEDSANYYVNLGRTLGILPKTELIGNEKLVMNSAIKAVITKIDINSKGVYISLSRSHYSFLKAIIELEIPEIVDGIITVHTVAREAGYRSKVALSSNDNRVDPIGACIGERGSRISNIIKELNGEKIDLVLYNSDPAEYIKNALAPAKDVTVLINDEAKRIATAVVDGDNYSLAIGKRGQNVRLAARLTQFKIDVKTREMLKAEGINFS